MSTEEIYQFYPQDPQLRDILDTHSRMVANLALRIARLNPQLKADVNFIEEAAMLHDIGIAECNAPDICCHGTAPYICHGVIGSEILTNAGYPRHALVCERHTGSGLTRYEIESRNMPLPRRDMLPLSIEEKIICYADKFYSKSGNLTQRKSLDSVIRGMARHGRQPLERFLALHNLLKP